MLVDVQKLTLRLHDIGIIISEFIAGLKKLSTIGKPECRRRCTFLPRCCVQGKVKVVAENRTGVHLEPTPNYDSHMAKSSLDVTPASQQQLYELYQVRPRDQGWFFLSTQPQPLFRPSLPSQHPLEYFWLA